MGKEAANVLPESHTEQPKTLFDRFFPKNTRDKREKIDQPGTVISRAFDKLLQRTKKTQVKEEVRKAIVEVKKEILPKKPYDLAGAIEHFNSLKPEVKTELSKYFGGKWVNASRGNFDLLDEVYDFQVKNKLDKKDGIAGIQTRIKIAEKSNGKYFEILYVDQHGTSEEATKIFE